MHRTEHRWFSNPYRFVFNNVRCCLCDQQLTDQIGYPSKSHLLDRRENLRAALYRLPVVIIDCVVASILTQLASISITLGLVPIIIIGTARV